jgi:diguanylate cyclase (GGDEF)-like protein
MNLSAAEISLLVVELLTALALAVLWWGDRQRTYTMWWAIMHATLPLPAFFIGYLRANPTPTNPLVPLHMFIIATQAVCLLAGVFSYRAMQQRPWWRPAVAAIFALIALFYVPSLFWGANWMRVSEVTVLAAALIAAAVLMWPQGRLERVAAICFAVRGTYEATLLLLVATGRYDMAWFKHTPSFSALVAISTALVLLIAAYQRSLDRLRDQYRILELSQEITAQLQGVTDETSLAQRVLAVMTQRLDWKQGAFFRPVDTLGSPGWMLVANVGDDAGQLKVGQPIATLDEGMLASAVRTQSVCYSPELIVDTRVSDAYRDNPLIADNPSLVVIPVIHDRDVLGAIVMRDMQRRELPETEIRMLESLGQVIGISLNNARNLEELAHRANHDALTGLGNRAALHDSLRSNGSASGAVMLFDLDHFKQINDALGHAVGDNLLRALAERLQHHLAERPVQLFRLGGDEFVILYAIDSLDAQGAALALARELAEVIAHPIQIGEFSLRAPASIGVALAPAHGDSHELLRCADVAMYHAKQSGTGVAFYEREIDAYKLEHLTLLSAVNDGLDKNQFALFYQPIINLATGAIDGCEGLIRWHHPALGLIGAAKFMSLVEATDLIRALTYRVIDIAMSDAARWQQRGIDTRISINLSARNILDSELPTYLLQAAARHSVNPSRIALEITETILIKDPASAAKVLQQLADAGFLLALDDFGTGYSSLAYLARFPIHTLKIDRSFVREMLTHAQSRAIVESTIALARGLGLKVTAEGVEQEAEAQLLRELGCDCAQGYLFSHPIPEAQLMAEWPRLSAAAMAI